MLIGLNLHIYCGAAEIKSIRSTRSSMAIELTGAGARTGDLFVYSHYLPVLRLASGLVISNTDQAGENVWRIRMRDRKHGAAQRIELSILLPVTRQWWFWSLIALAAAGFLTTTWRYVISLRLERRLALDQERSRISRDLHDGMGADLTQIALIAEMAARQPGLLPAAREPLDRIVASTHNLAGELDSVVWATNPGNDTLEHLVQYLGNYAQVFLEVADLRLRLGVPPQLPELAVSSATRHNLFLAAKETLHNVVRHAGATCASTCMSASRITRWWWRSRTTAGASPSAPPPSPERTDFPTRPTAWPRSKAAAKPCPERMDAADSSGSACL